LKKRRKKKKSGVNGNSKGGTNDSPNRPEDEIDDLDIVKNESKGNDNSYESLTNYFNEDLISHKNKPFF
jgi:hypothetical protein